MNGYSESTNDCSNINTNAVEATDGNSCLQTLRMKKTYQNKLTCIPNSKTQLLGVHIPTRIMHIKEHFLTLV